VALNFAAAVDEELDVIAQWVDSFDGDRIDASDENLEKVSRRPAPLEAGAELRSFSSSARARNRSSRSRSVRRGVALVRVRYTVAIDCACRCAKPQAS
jgi:hypothetical protein